MAKSERIRYLAGLTKGCHTVVDIGSDHGFVLKEALEKHGAAKGIATDIREKPLLQAKNNLIGLSVSYVLSDGFENVSEPFDCAVVSGMGAYLVSDIMACAPEDDGITYVLQANDKTDVLRTRLVDQGFTIMDEHIIRDGRYYVILVVRRGNSRLDEKDIVIGPHLKRKKEALGYYRHMATRLKSIRKQAGAAATPSMDERIALFEEAVRDLEHI
jgi:tRNA (adenine22-N1)-methyltransferase